MHETISVQTHISNIRSLAVGKGVGLIDAVAHYTEFNGLDPYFVADVVQTDKHFMSELHKEAKMLKLIK